MPDMTYGWETHAETDIPGNMRVSPHETTLSGTSGKIITLHVLHYNISTYNY